MPSACMRCSCNPTRNDHHFNSSPCTKGKSRVIIRILIIDTANQPPLCRYTIAAASCKKVVSGRKFAQGENKSLVDDDGDHHLLVGSEMNAEIIKTSKIV
jgi:hypothetical protein